jgi:iron(III) transport system permease protein
VIKANTDAEGVDGVSNTFVYTVLLMVITGVTMYLVYGRAGRKSGKTAKATGGTGDTTPVLVEAAPAESVRVP